MEGAVVLIDPTGQILWTLPLVLYAETHYRFRYFFSLLKKKEPELIADAPFRIEPGQKLTVLILAKDGHRYRSTLKKVSAVISHEGKVVREQTLISKGISLKKKWWWRVFEIDTQPLSGWIELNVLFELESERGSRKYVNDNYRISTKKPLRVYLSPYRLPGPKGTYQGDLHTHSNYTDDQVEFGAPLEASRSLSKAAGLSFFAVTDHSYDLDDKIDDYLTNDTRLPKWKALLSEVDVLNRNTRGFVILRGEEVSCRNRSGKNVHLLLLGNRTFVHGSGDGAERWLRTRSESSIEEVLVRSRNGALSFAAHPREPVPLLQRILIGRGNWSDADIRTPSLTGVQFLNGLPGSGLQKGLQQWKTGLLGGWRLIAIAGNDAHGNFNKFRQIGIPFLTIREMPFQIFGGMRTAIFLNKPPVNEKSILDAIRTGNCVINDGPITLMTVEDEHGKKSQIGGRIAAGRLKVTVTLTSTPEFGECREIKAWLGVIGEKTETLSYWEESVSGYEARRDFTLTITRRSYLRLEMRSSRQNQFDGEPHFCLTNPIWIDTE